MTDERVLGERERCPGCGEFMQWEGPQNYGESGCWACDPCGAHFTLDTEAREWRYFHVTEAGTETELGPTFEGAAARLKETRGG